MAKFSVNEFGYTDILATGENNKEITLKSYRKDGKGWVNVQCAEVMALSSPTPDGANSRVKLVYRSQFPSGKRSFEYAFIKETVQDILDIYREAGLIFSDPVYKKEDPRLSHINPYTRHTVGRLKTILQL